MQSDGGTGTDITLVPRTSHLITFSEYGVGTIITNQYQSDGVVFSEDPVKNKTTGKTTYVPCEIYDDSADPTSPALANFAHGDYSGPIIGHFVDPNTGANGTVTQFSFDAGYFDNAGSTEVEWFNAKHKLIGSMREETLGVRSFQHCQRHADLQLRSRLDIEGVKRFQLRQLDRRQGDGVTARRT